ncbi:hypothetical protein [Nocardioides kribbensis]|uniref:hypothetical protein n=1 Tax=Nocardioides kribbensis TaxID=305517 RepID=UPI001879596E|nr:hypothetical protein [Nocardioides kribbensis]
MSAISTRDGERMEVRAVRDIDGSPLVRIDVEANPTEFYDLTPHQARDLAEALLATFRLEVTQ